MYSFSRRNIHEPRLVWNPAVHELYGEKCYYYLLRMKNPQQKLVDVFEAVLKEVGINSYCIYVLYGYYDVLLRIWARPERRATLSHRLEKDARFLAIEAVEEFIAEVVEYMWAGKITPQDVAPYKNRVEDLCRAVAAGSALDAELVSSLMHAGLLHQINVPSDSSSVSKEESLIKFYWLWQSFPEQRQQTSPIAYALLRNSPKLGTDRFTRELGSQIIW